MQTTRPPDHRWSLSVGVAFGGALLVMIGYSLAFGGESGSRAGAWLLAMGNALLLVSIMSMGAPVRGRTGSVLRVAIIASCLFQGGAIALVLSTSASESATSALTLGFPFRTAIVLYGVGVLPMLALPALFAWSFDDSPFDPSRMAALRRLRPPDLPDDASADVERGS